MMDICLRLLNGLASNGREASARLLDPTTTFGAVLAGAATALTFRPTRVAGCGNRKLKIFLTAGVALAPLAAQAASPDVWNGATSNAWETGSNWSTGAKPTTTNAVTIGVATHNPVQINSNVFLNATSGTNIGSLTIGAGFGSTESLNINSGYTLTMGTHAITLSGGAITGLGTLSSSGGITGYGTISAPISGNPNFTANATNGNAFGGFSPFVNGTPGTPISLVNQSLTGDSFTISNHGNFSLSGDTLNGVTLNGVSTNLNAGSAGGNNYYGLFSVVGNSTLKNTINNTNYQQSVLQNYSSTKPAQRLTAP
jgi:hypothetical protein